MLARALFSGDEHKRVIFMRASEHTGAVYLPIFNAGGSTMRPGPGVRLEFKQIQLSVGAIIRLSVRRWN